MLFFILPSPVISSVERACRTNSNFQIPLPRLAFQERRWLTTTDKLQRAPSVYRMISRCAPGWQPDSSQAIAHWYRRCFHPVRMSAITAESIRIEPAATSQKLRFPWKKMLLWVVASLALGLIFALTLPLRVS